MTRRSPHPEPTLRRTAALLVAATTGGVVLWLAPATAPPPDLHGTLDWWAQEGTPAATMATIRALGLAAAAWAMALAAFGVVVSVSRSPGASQVWVVVAPNSFRRLVATSVLAGVTATSAGSGAAEPPAIAPPLLIDLGDAGDPEPPVLPLPLLISLGPIEQGQAPPEAQLGAPTGEAPGDAEESWTVERGDHLWRVAHETLEDRGANTADEDVARYWLRLIERNRDVIGADLDLIHPGLVLRLPA